MDNKKIYINPRQFGMLNESEWNFHFGGDGKYGYASKSGGGHDLRPHMSDNKFVMPGRDTGHFGSGTYFSTYKKGEYSNGADVGGYGDEFENKDPHFIQVGNGLYRVDFDIYKNLYKVWTKKHGDVLYTMMESLNRFYNSICRNFAKFDSSSAYYGNARLYQIIRRNAYGLGLKCPSYYQLTRMAQAHGRDNNAIQSFSTLFMEWNGYNGVNVSGVDYYDNSKHGSVIYDLSKIDTTMEQVDPRNLSLFSGLGDNSSYNNTIVNTSFTDDIADSLSGKYPLWVSKLNDMPISQATRLLKNYNDSNHILNAFMVSRNLNDDLAKRYLRYVFVNPPSGIWGYNSVDREFLGDNSRYFCELIDKLGAYYWVNYDSNRSDSVLIILLNNFIRNLPWSLSIEEEKVKKQEYLDMLMSYMQRDLTKYEKKYIDKDYF